jgi:hypothetical protein
VVNDVIHDYTAQHRCPRHLHHRVTIEISDQICDRGSSFAPAIASIRAISNSR